MASCSLCVVIRRYARGLVDGQLLADRQVHGKMQEGIGAATLHRVIRIGRIRVFQIRVVFRVLQRPIDRHGFQRA